MRCRALLVDLGQLLGEDITVLGGVDDVDLSPDHTHAAALQFVRLPQLKRKQERKKERKKERKQESNTSISTQSTTPHTAYHVCCSSLSSLSSTYLDADLLRCADGQQRI